MKMASSQRFVILFISCHFLFICIQIYNYTQITSYSYLKQKHEKTEQFLQLAIQELTQELYALKNLKEIKEYAHNILHMRKIRLNQIHQINRT